MEETFLQHLSWFFNTEDYGYYCLSSNVAPRGGGLHLGDIDYDNTLAVVMPETGELGRGWSELCRFGKK